MAVGIRRIVKSNISMSRPPVDKVDFGRALVFSHEYYLDNGTVAAEVSNAESLLELGIKKDNGQALSAEDPLYRAVQQFTAKEKFLFVLGLRHKNDNTDSTEVYSVTTNGSDFDGIIFSFSLTINSASPVTISITGASGDNSQKVLDKLLTKVEAADTGRKLVTEVKNGKLSISPADITDTITVEAADNTTSELTSERSPRASISTMIHRILKDKAAYIVLSPTRNEQTVKDIAEALKGKKLRYFSASNDSGIADTPASSATDIMHHFGSKGTEGVSVLYSTQADNFPEFCWVSERIGYPPSSVKWAYSECGDIVPDDLTETQLQNIMDKNGNCYTTIAGRKLVMGGGVFSDGTFIDLRIGMDWQDEEVTKTIFAELTKKEKRDFDDVGITYFGEILRVALEKGKKYFSHSYEIHLPKSSDFTADDRATRNLTGIRWQVRAKSGIQTAELHGEIGT